MSADKTIADILARFGETPRDATWKVQSATVILHKALERIAAQAKIRFLPPTVLRAERDEAVILVTGTMGDLSEWSIGEAVITDGSRPGNYKVVTGRQAAYPYAMAEKRAKDRVILKLIGLHGLLYSEEEADDFKESRGHSAPAPAGEARAGSEASSPATDFPGDAAIGADLSVAIDGMKSAAEITAFMQDERTTKMLAGLPDAIAEPIRMHARRRVTELRRKAA